MATLLIAESDRITAELLAKQFSSDGLPHRTLIATTADEVRAALRSDEPDLVLVRHGPLLDRLGGLLDGDGGRPRGLVHGVRPDWDDTDGLPPWADDVVRGDVPAEQFVREVKERLPGAAG